MPTIHETITAALQDVPNSWAIELPTRPKFPAVVFNVETNPEDAWCMGGGYDQHTVQIVALADTVEELDALIPTSPATGPIRAGMEALDCFQYEDSSGDAVYEPDPKKYGRHVTVVLRTPRY